MSYRTTASDTNKMPTGIPYIIGNEVAERFSFYGMKAALAVFIAQYLHLMGHDQTDQISNLTASSWVHNFNIAVYLTPLLGAIISDLLWGKYSTIIRLSIVYCLGHLALAFMGIVGPAHWWLLAGLGLIAIGAGGIKPCVSAHVGDQFGTNNQHLLTKVFNWFYFSINLGSALSSISIPWLLEWYGPHIAFGIPGALMVIATILFWVGRGRFVHIPASGRFFLKELFSKDGIVSVLKLSIIFGFVAIFWSLFDQTATTWVFQSQDMNREFLGKTWLPSQIQAVNPFLILILIPVFTYVIYPKIQKITRFGALRKIAVGLFITALSFAVSALIQHWIDNGDTPHIGWQVFAYLLLTSGEIMVSIVCLEFAYTQAPKTMKSWIMALFLVSVAAGNFITSAVNYYIHVPSPHANEIALFNKKKKDDKNARYVEIDGYQQNLQHQIRVHFKENGSVSHRDVPSRQQLKETAGIIEQWVNKNDKIPTTSEGQLLIKGSTDQFDSPLHYRMITGSQFRIQSDGPDKEALTQWDTSLIVDYKKPNSKKTTEEKKPTWLDKRKAELGIKQDEEKKETFSYNYTSGNLNKLEGASYYWFFTGLMLVAAILFIPAARFYRRSYLKNQPSQDPSEEQSSEAEATLTQH